MESEYLAEVTVTSMPPSRTASPIFPVGPGVVAVGCRPGSARGAVTDGTPPRSAATVGAASERVVLSAAPPNTVVTIATPAAMIATAATAPAISARRRQGSGGVPTAPGGIPGGREPGGGDPGGGDPGGRDPGG